MNTKARIDMLEKRNEELTEKLKQIEKNRYDMFVHLNNEVKQKMEELKEYEVGAQQIKDMMNSMLIGVALDYGGEIKVRRDHLKLLDEYMYATTYDKDNYIFSIKKRDTCTEECDKCDWAVCPYRKGDEESDS